MLTREAMVEAFGADGLVRLDVSTVREKGLSDDDARILSEVGLPVRADVAFTTFVEGDLEAGTPVVFQTGSGEVDVLVLGAVAPDGDMRYFLDVQGGSVGMLDLGDPKAERVNSSLAHFVEFLYRLRVRQQELTDAAGDLDNKQYTEQLWQSLKELDPAAFGHGEAWWSMVLDNVLGRSFIEETRAFLQQRRAEVAGQLEEQDEPEESREPEERDESRRGGFDRAIRDLAEEGYRLLDAERFGADTESYGLLHLPGDLDQHFDADGALVKDVQIAWKGVVTSKIQSLFARQGLVVRVPSELVDDEALYDMSEEERQKYADSLMEQMVAAANGEQRPGEGTMTCLAGDGTSDLCRIVAAFDRLAADGYIAEPALWPTPSGAWEKVQERVKPGETRGAVFWTTQSHTDSFDDRGDLVGDLYLQWAGEPEVIAERLRTSGLEVEVPADEGTAFVIRRGA